VGLNKTAMPLIASVSCSSRRSLEFPPAATPDETSSYRSSVVAVRAFPPLARAPTGMQAKFTHYCPINRIVLTHLAIRYN